MPKNDPFDSTAYSNASFELATFAFTHMARKISTFGGGSSSKLSLVEKEWVNPSRLPE